MSSASRCPNQDELRLFLMGQVAESNVESLETHVAECQDCVAVLSQLQAGDPFESAIRAAALHAKPVDSDANRLVAHIVGAMDSRSQSISTTVSGGAAPPTDLDLSWLSPPEADDELGRVGAFRVLRVIGQGGMGVVFEAEDLKLQRRLALKVMLPKAAADPAGAARFLREARASAKVRHPNVVTVYQADSFGTVPFIAMELLHGESLHERLRRVGQLPLKDVLNLGRQIALGLAAAHAQGLLHRDIKPANIWLEQNEDEDVIAKVLDFGLARSVDSDGSLTQSGMIVGTPQYMAPEQARGATPNIRSDLFSLGCVLYQMTTGRQPFVGRNVLDQLRALAVDVPLPVSELRDNAPSELVQLIHQLLEKTPSSRPASATELAERLREIATPQVQSPQVNHWSWQRWTLMAIAVTVVLSVAGIALRENRPAGEGTQSTSPASATTPPLVSKPVVSASTPQGNLVVNSVDLQTSKQKFDALTTEGVQVLSDGTKPGDEWADNGLRMKFCWCPPGTFTMGSPLNEPARRPDEGQVAVTLTSGFWIGKYEVTEREWQTIIEQVSQAQSNVGKRNDGGTGPSFPKSDLNYDEAIEFCRRLTERERRIGHLAVDWEYQLPTEAQWEYACRAGTKTATTFGDGMGSHQANCRGDAAYNGPIGPSLQRVTEVGSYKPNTWGIHDMHGNVWEWCRDAYSEKYPGGRDPEVSTPASYRVGRGGGFDSFAGYCRSAIRFRMKPDSHSFGFRVAIVRRQPLVAKPETLDSAPRGMNERDQIKAADGKRHDVQLFWTGNEKQENISVKTAFLDGHEPTTILDFQKRWGINDFADITIDENTRRIYLGLPREENRDARIVSFDYDGHQLREELQSNFVWSLCVDESRQRLYVSGAGPSGIFSVPLSGNGTDRHQFTIPKTFYANGLTVDPIEQKVYWVDPGPGVRTGGKLQRSNLEGTVVENVMTGLLEPTGLALDPIAKTIYWVEGYPPRVRSANYDGTNAKTLVAGESRNREDNYWDIAFDKPSGKLYFISRAAISRCDRDGSNLEHLFAPGGDCLKISRGTPSPESPSVADAKSATQESLPSQDRKPSSPDFSRLVITRPPQPAYVGCQLTTYGAWRRRSYGRRVYSAGV